MDADDNPDPELQEVERLARRFLTIRAERAPTGEVGPETEAPREPMPEATRAGHDTGPSRAATVIARHLDALTRTNPHGKRRETKQVHPPPTGEAPPRADEAAEL